MESTEFIQDLAVVLIAAAVLGWVAQRLGLSAVAGFLLAGIVAGPATPPFALVNDAERIRTLAEVGLVFLMFSIGLRLSVRRLKRFGLALPVAVAVGAMLVLNAGRFVGTLIGYSDLQSMFLAAMFAVSSSAIIFKVLHETGATHERAGQLAMGIAVLEDVVAVVMLTVLNSAVQFGKVEGGPPVGQTLMLLAAFVVLLSVAGLLIVPTLLRRMSLTAGEELQTLGVVGLLFALALLAERAGYSLALGAFLLGTIVAETPHRHQVERIMEGLRDVFSAVFFVAIGLQIDARVMLDAWPLIVGMAVFTLVCRTAATAVALTVVGHEFRDAVRTGLLVTPIGEFSFIIAQMGVAAAVVPKEFYPLAVGVSLATTFLAAGVARRSEAISLWVGRRQPAWLSGLLGYYRDWLLRVSRRQQRNVLWQLSRKRFLQIGVTMFFVTGLLVYAEQLFHWWIDQVGRDFVFSEGAAVVFWVVLAFVVLAPLVAIWRNIGALALLYAEVTTANWRSETRFRGAVEQGIKVFAAAAMWLWLAALLPLNGPTRWMVLGSIALALVGLLVLRRKLVYWHSELEVELQDLLAEGSHTASVTTAPFLRAHGDWNLHVVDCTIPDLADCAGRSIADLQLRVRFGCTVVGIERQGVLISLPAPQRELFPRDRVLLLGTTEQVRAAQAALGLVSGVAPATEFDELHMETLDIPPGSPAAGHTLVALAPGQTHGVQIAGIERGLLRVLNPSGDFQVETGDRLLLLGTSEQIRGFREWLRENGAAG